MENAGSPCAGEAVMTIADLCLFGMVLLIIASITPAKVAGLREYDNANPRDPAFYTPGLRRRSQGAHLNGYEALPFFAAAILLAEMRGMPQGSVDVLAAAFLVARVGYVAAYLADRPTVRSVIWFVGFACNVGLFFLPALVGGY
jgi:uncharacterized MAPEG superfamily protein